jgi:hypothetical protein
LELAVKLWPRAALALLVGHLTACGEDWSDPPGLGAGRLRPVPGCEKLDHRPCDVTVASCQERLMALAACVRGCEPAPPPPITTMTEAEFVEYVNERLAEQDPPPDPNHYEAALSMLMLARTGDLDGSTLVEEHAKWIAGLYRWEPKDIVLVEHAEKRDVTESSIVLFHELIHALQDLDVDLRSFEEEHGKTKDSATAVDALVEGEAKLFEARYAASAFGLDPATIDWTRRFQGAIDLSVDALLEQVSLYVPGYRDFPYTWGARYAHLIHEGGGFGALLERYASPVLTTRAVMASIDGTLVDEPAPPALPEPVAPTEWAPFTETTLGAFGSYLLMLRATRDPARSLAAAVAWRNDRLFVYGSVPPALSSTALSWRLDFATDTDAATFTEALSTVALPARQTGTRVTLALARDRTPVEWGFAP